MKKIVSISLSILAIVFMTSCGISNAVISNHNENLTQVQLTGKNFKVIDKISGSASIKYVLLVGGMKQTQLYENAYSAMLTKANLINSSRAIINIVSEEHLGGVFPFAYKRTVTVSAHVIEFTQ